MSVAEPTRLPGEIDDALDTYRARVVAITLEPHAGGSAEERHAVKEAILAALRAERARAEQAEARLAPMPCGHWRDAQWSEMHASAKPYCTICRFHDEIEERDKEIEGLETRLAAVREAAEAYRDLRDGGIGRRRVDVFIALLEMKSDAVLRAALATLDGPEGKP